jgi:hypothetical protein
MARRYAASLILVLIARGNQMNIDNRSKYFFKAVSNPKAKVYIFSTAFFSLTQPTIIQ